MEKHQLNGIWSFVHDMGSNSGDYVKPTWDRFNWKKVAVPGCWNKYAPEYALYDGIGWFARDFVVEQLPENPVAFLKFDGVNYAAEIYLNGACVGQHEGGYTAFSVDVSSALMVGRNELVVKVDNRRSEIKLPAVMGWFNYGGIHRDVNLLITESAQIKEVRIQVNPVEDVARGVVAVDVFSHDSGDLKTGFQVRAAVSDTSGQVVWESRYDLDGGDRQVKADIQFDHPTRWSIEEPTLYELSVSLLKDGQVIDATARHFGVRDVSVSGSQIHLNGHPVWIKGMNYVYEHPVCGAALTKEVIDADLDSMVEAGINTVRIHFPPSNYFMDECDKRGVLVYCEVPIYCMHMKGFDWQDDCYERPAYLTLARQMLREMMMSHHHHPSVVIWGVGNECDTWDPKSKPFFESLLKEMKQFDRSRPICYASLWKDDDVLYDMVDVIGINEYIGWYDRIDSQVVDETLADECEAESGAKNLFVPPLDLSEMEQRLEAFSKKHKKPMIFTEFGADAIPKYISEDRRLWSENYQMEYLSTTFSILLKNPRVAGAFPFCFNDYPDPSKPVNEYWDGVNYKGIVSSGRVPKLAYGVMRDIYSGID